MHPSRDLICLARVSLAHDADGKREREKERETERHGHTPRDGLVISYLEGGDEKYPARGARWSWTDGMKTEMHDQASASWFPSDLQHRPQQSINGNGRKASAQCRCKSSPFH